MWWKPLNWNHFSSELQDALSTIIHSPTLKTFHLRDVPLPRENVNVPIMLFHGIHLTTLVLDSLSPNDFDRKQSRLPTPVASDGGATIASPTVIDRCVWNCYRPGHGTRFPTSAYFSLILDME